MKQIVFAALIAFPAHAETPLLETCRLAGEGFVDQSGSYDRISTAFQSVIEKVSKSDPSLTAQLSEEILEISAAIIEGRAPMRARLDALKDNCLP